MTACSAFFARPRGLQERGEVGAGAHLRDLELDRADPGVPAPGPVAVAVGGPFGAPLVGRRPDWWETSVSITAWASTRTPSRSASTSSCSSSLPTNDVMSILGVAIVPPHLGVNLR